MQHLRGPRRRPQARRAPAHCDAAGRDYDEIEKTAIFAMDPSSTADDIAATANGAAEAGFTAAYVYARGITDPGRVIALLADATARLN